MLVLNTPLFIDSLMQPRARRLSEWATESLVECVTCNTPKKVIITLQNRKSFVGLNQSAINMLARSG